MRPLALLLSLVLAQAVGSGAHAADGQAQRIEDKGVAVEFALDDTGAQDVLPRSTLLRLKLSDAASGQAIGNARPAAWIVRRRSLSDAELDCGDRAKQLSQGSLGARADVDLNAYRLITLNSDRTVGFINPFVSINRSKLESIVALPGLGADWVLAARSGMLYVAVPDTGEVAVIDSATRRLTTRVALGAGARPTRLALDDARGMLWVGLAGTPDIVAIDIARLEIAHRVVVGEGTKAMAIAPAAPYLAASSEAGDRVTIVDLRDAGVRTLAAAGTRGALQWSEAASAFVAVVDGGARLALIDPTQATIRQHIEVGEGASYVRLADGGRLALVLRPALAKLDVVDLGRGAAIASLPVVEAADRIAFTRGFAYVHSGSTPGMTLVDLAALRAVAAGNGQPRVVTIPFGRRAPAEGLSDVSIGDVVVPAPEGNGVYAANPAEGQIYRYSEGLMVPSGSLSNYRRAALGVLLLDGSLRSEGDGRFVGQARFEQPGKYDLVVRTAQPAATACFTLTVNGTAPKSASEERAKAKLLDAHRVGDRMRVRVALLSGEGKPVRADDAVLLAVQQPGAQWQHRVHLRAEPDGSYSAELAPPRGAALDLLVSAPSMDMSYAAGRVGRIGEQGGERAGAGR